VRAEGGAGRGIRFSDGRIGVRVQEAVAAQLHYLAASGDEAVDDAYDKWLCWLFAVTREPGLTATDVAMKLALVVREMATEGLIASDGFKQDTTSAAMFRLLLSALLDLVLLQPIAARESPAPTAGHAATSSRDAPPFLDPSE